MAQNVTPLFGDKNKSDTSDANWLTATEVVARTGISRTDLVRFIQLKTLPEAMMRFTTAGPDGSRRIHAFSASILEWVARLQQLRETGQSVEAIATAIRQAENDGPSAGDPTPPSAPDAASAPPAKTDRKDDLPRFHLPSEAISGSAFFIDPTLHIGWIKVAPDDRLFATIRDEIDDNPSGTVFDILLRASLKELVFDWQPLFTFIYQFLREITPAAMFNRLAPVIELPMDAAVPSTSGSVKPRQRPPVVDSCPIRVLDAEDRMWAMRLYAIALAEGTICLFEPANALDSLITDTSHAVIPDAATDTAAMKTAFGVLSARIDDSQHIVATLLPETYFQMMKRIWEVSDAIVAACGGQRAKRSGTDVQYIIPQQADTDPAFDAIRCAVAMRKKIEAINHAWKEDGQWVADIRLNIGISSGRDHLPAEDPSASMAFMLPGGAADQALHLSGIAQGGAILITKSAFGHLSAEQMDRITFGIYRNDRLIPRIFAQVAEFPAGPDSPAAGQEIRSMFITRIIDLKSDPDA